MDVSNTPLRENFSRRFTRLHNEMKAIDKKEWTNPKTAEKLGCTVDAIKSWRRYDYFGYPDTWNLIQIADLFGKSLDYIACRTDYDRIGDKEMSEITGLSSEAIHSLSDLTKNQKRVLEGVLRSRSGITLINLIGMYLDSDSIDEFFLDPEDFDSDVLGYGEVDPPENPMWYKQVRLKSNNMLTGMKVDVTIKPQDLNAIFLIRIQELLSKMKDVLNLVDKISWRERLVSYLENGGELRYGTEEARTDLPKQKDQLQQLKSELEKI